MEKITYKVVEGLRLHQPEGHHLHTIERFEKGKITTTHEECELAPEHLFCGDMFCHREDHNKKINCSWRGGITTHITTKTVEDEECTFPHPSADTQPDPDWGDWYYSGLGE